MKLHLNPTVRIITTFVFSVLIISSPLLVNAQSIGNVQNLFALFLNVLNLYVVPIIFALAFVMFLVGVYRYFIAGAADEEKVKTGRNFVLWSLVGFFLMFSVWGLINLLVGSFQLASNNEPGLPQFNGAGTSAISSNPIASIFGNLLGGSSVGTATNSTALVPGNTLVSQGISYPITGANTVQSQNGACPTGFPLIGGTNTCQRSGTTSGSGSGNGTVQTNGSCQSSADCSGGNECNVSTYTCQPDNGLGQQGDQCTTNNECQGNFVCDENSMTCQDPNAAGVSEVGTGAGDKTQGQSCSSSADCSSNLECNVSTQTCQPDNGLGQQGDQCTSDNDCQGNYICDTNSQTCQDPNAAGTNETGDGSAQSSDMVTCSDGTQAPASIGCSSCADGSTTGGNCPTTSSSGGFDDTGGDGDY
jgi:hypothetical protein